MFLAGRRFGRNSAPLGEFLGMFWSIGTVFALRNFPTFCNFEVQPPAAAIHDLLGFWGSGRLREVSRPPGAPEWAKKAEKVHFPGLGGRSGRKARRPNLITCYMRTQCTLFGVPCDPGTRDLAVFFWGGARGRFVGWGPVLSVSDPPNIAKTLEKFIVRCGFKKCGFVENRAIFLLFWPLVHPTRAVRTEKTYSRFQARNGAQTLKKWIPPVLGTVLGETPAHPI